MTALELSERLARVEQSNRRWRNAAAAFAAACFVLIGLGQATEEDPARPDDARTEQRRIVSLSVLPAENGGETLYRLWSDGNIERKRSPIFDFRGGDKWELLRRP